MIIKRTILFLILFFQISLLLMAQEYSITVYDEDNSPLPDNDVRAVIFDEDENAWIGTYKGLALFDGQNWTIFDESNSGMPADYVYALNIDSQGNIWIGSRGLVKYDGVNWTVYNQDNSGLVKNQVSTIAIDQNDNLWLGSYLGGGLVKFDGTNWTNYTKSNSDLSGDWINDIDCYEPGNVWIAVEGGGVSKFDGTNWITYSKSNGLITSNVIKALSFDNQGLLWIAMESWSDTFEGGLSKFNGVEWTKYGFPVLLGVHIILPFNSLAVDSEGNKWAGSRSMGLGKFKDEDWTMFTDVESSWPLSGGNTVLSSNKVNNLTVDNSDNIWICTDDAGLCILNENGAAALTDEQNHYIPYGVLLYQNYPNPFNPSTTIKYSIPSVQPTRRVGCTLKIYDLLGREVATLVNEQQRPGYYEVEFPAVGGASELSSGVYYYQLRAGRFVETKKLILQK